MIRFFGFLFAFAVFCSLALAVGFPWKQAVLLAVFAAYVSVALFQVASRVAVTMPPRTFQPYDVRIFPNWPQILTEYTPAKSDEDQMRFLASCGRTQLPGAQYSVLRNDKDGVLLYRGSELGFSTAFDWTYEVKKSAWLRGAKREAHLDGFPDSMDFQVKQRSDVIQLGLTVGSDWWRTCSAHCPAPVEIHEEPLFGQVEIVLAQLPIREFDLYWDEVDYQPKAVERTWKSVKENRKKHGWEEMAKSPDVPSSLQPITLKHKYFEVHHRSMG